MSVFKLKYHVMIHSKYLRTTRCHLNIDYTYLKSQYILKTAKTRIWRNTKLKHILFYATALRVMNSNTY